MSEHRYQAGAYGVCQVCNKDLASHIKWDGCCELHSATIAELESERDQLTEQLAIRSESGMQEIMRINNELQKRIGELDAERDQFREYAHAITKALTGLVGGGSEMFAGRIATGTDREMFKADLPFCVQRIRDRYERSHNALCDAVRREKAAEQALTAERQRLATAEIALRDVIEGNYSGVAARAPETEEIEVTPEMIAAGRREIASVWLDFVSDRGGDMWPEVLTAVFRSMFSESGLAHPAAL